jgi:tetratricopeptide (TPR) repeat protein
MRRSRPGSPRRSLSFAFLLALATLAHASPTWAESQPEERRSVAEDTTPASEDAAPPSEDVAPVASDSPTEIAKQNYRIGVAAFGEGRFDDAITAFLVADRLAPNAALSFNIARANDELGRIEESLYWYGDYLRRAPDAGDRSTVLALIAKKELTLAERGQQLLVVLPTPSDAAVFVDDQKVGTSPWHGVLAPGTHTVRVELLDHDPWIEAVVLPKDRSLVLQPSLAPTQALPPPEVIVAPEPSPPPPVTPRPVAERSPTSDFGVWPWVALGAGAVGFGAAAGFEFARQGAEDDAENGQVQLEVRESLERMDRHQTTARVMLGLGVVFTAVGGTLLVLDQEEAPPVAFARGSSLLPTFDAEGFELRVLQKF